VGLILVVAGDRPLDDVSGSLLQRLTDALPPASPGATISYVADGATAAAAARREIAAGRNHVTVVPIDIARHGTGRSSSGAPRWPSDLDARMARVRRRWPDAEVAVLRSRSGSMPSLGDVLGMLRPEGSEDPELLGGAIERAFAGDTQRFGRFVAALQAGVPPETRIGLRGSAVQGHAYATAEPFDARGPGSSDLDVVLFGEAAMAAWDPAAFFLSGVNTMPLADDNPWIAPSLEPARREAQAIAGRPVSIQAMTRWFMDLRSGLQGQSWVLLDG
jgi:hypothetical protein